MTLKEQLLDIGLCIDNEYLDKYVELIESNRETKRQKFKTQKHHIIPKCIAKIINYQDVNAKQNIVNLSHKDHLYAHWWLYNAVENKNYKYRLGIAILEFENLKRNKKVNLLSIKNIEEIVENYDELRTSIYQEMSLRFKNRVVSETTKNKMKTYWTNYYKNGGKSPNIGRKHSIETKNKISIGNKNKERTKEFREYLSNKLRGREPWNKGKKTPRSIETKNKLKSLQLIWFNNGEVEIKTNIENVPENFVKGRLKSFRNNKDALNKRNYKMRNKIWMNNGIVSKMIDIDKVSLFESSGWFKGRKLNKNI